MAIDPIGIGGVSAGGGGVPYEGPYQFILSVPGYQTASGTWDTPATADYRFSVIGIGGTGSWAAGSGLGANGVDSDWVNIDKDVTFSYSIPMSAPSSSSVNNTNFNSNIGINISANQSYQGITATRAGQMGGHGGSYYNAGQPGFGRYGGKGGNARNEAGYPYGGGGGGGHPYAGGGNEGPGPGGIIIEIDQTNDAFE